MSVWRLLAFVLSFFQLRRAACVEDEAVSKAASKSARSARRKEELGTPPLESPGVAWCALRHRNNGIKTRVGAAVFTTNVPAAAVAEAA